MNDPIEEFGKHPVRGGITDASTSYEGRIAVDISDQLKAIGVPTLQEEAEVAAIRQALEAMLNVWEWVLTEDTSGDIHSSMQFKSMEYTAFAARCALTDTTAGAELLNERAEFIRLNKELQKLVQEATT